MSSCEICNQRPSKCFHSRRSGAKDTPEDHSLQKTIAESSGAVITQPYFPGILTKILLLGLPWIYMNLLNLIESSSKLTEG